MKKEGIELIGILALHNKLDHTYSINSVSRRYTNEGDAEIVTQLGVDWKIHIPFKTIVKALCDVYASAVINVWVTDNDACGKAYLQMHRFGRPKSIGLPGEWAWWSEW